MRAPERTRCYGAPRPGSGGIVIFGAYLPDLFEAGARSSKIGTTKGATTNQARSRIFGRSLLFFVFVVGVVGRVEFL